MAKWGEGDPRWIVEERPDSTNVNNWHWTEKNVLPIAKSQFMSLMKDLTLKEQGSEIKVVEIPQFEGDCNVATRKGKIFYFFDLNITLKIEASNKDGEETKGELVFHDVNQDDDDFDYIISMDTEMGDVRNILRTKFKDTFIEKLNEFRKYLKETFADKVLLPTNKPGDATNKSSSPAPDTKSQEAQPKSSSESAKKGSSKVGSVSLNLDLMASAHDIFEAFMDNARANIWSRGSAQIDRSQNGKFSFFGGNVQGIFTALESDSKIEMKWRLGHWAADHYSTVSISMIQGSSSTEVILKQSNVPIDEVDKTNKAWRSNFFNPMKVIFGWGIPDNV